MFQKSNIYITQLFKKMSATTVESEIQNLKLDQENVAAPVEQSAPLQKPKNKKETEVKYLLKTAKVILFELN